MTKRIQPALNPIKIEKMKSLKEDGVDEYIYDLVKNVEWIHSARFLDVLNNPSIFFPINP